MEGCGRIIMRDYLSIQSNHTNDNILKDLEIMNDYNLLYLRLYHSLHGPFKKET